MAEKQQIGGQKIISAGLHVEHLISRTKTEDSISIDNDRANTQSLIAGNKKAA
jgi:hypothetical protein